MNGQVLDGLNDPTDGTDAVRKSYVDTNDLKTLKYASPANLLDNSYFRYPVAQAGIGGNHGNQAYAVDRWILTNGSVSHQEGVGLTLNGTITQKLEHNPIFNAHAFVGMASGQASISYSDGAVTITSSGGVIAWAALYDTYENVYSEQVLPEYRPKGYTEELTACLRYYYSTGTVVSSGYVTSGAKNYTMPVELPVPMRVKPTVVGTPTWIARTPSGGYANKHGNSYEPFENLSVGGSVSADTCRLYLVDTVSDAVDINNMTLCFLITDFSLSADL